MSEPGEITKELGQIISLKPWEKAVFEHLGRPINVYLAGQRFQIIEVNPPYYDPVGGKTKFLLVDPQTFNPHDPKKGFVELPDEKRVHFGSAYPGLQYTGDVSPDHAAIKVVGKIIAITDLNSEKGTRVEIPQTKTTSP